MHIDEINALLFWYMDRGYGLTSQIPQFSQDWYNNLSDRQRTELRALSNTMAEQEDMIALCRATFTFA